MSSFSTQVAQVHSEFKQSNRSDCVFKDSLVDFYLRYTDYLLIRYQKVNYVILLLILY